MLTDLYVKEESDVVLGPGQKVTYSVPVNENTKGKYLLQKFKIKQGTAVAKHSMRLKDPTDDDYVSAFERRFFTSDGEQHVFLGRLPEEGMAWSCMTFCNKAEYFGQSVIIEYYVAKVSEYPPEDLSLQLAENIAKVFEELEQHRGGEFDTKEFVKFFSSNPNYQEELLAMVDAVMWTEQVERFKWLGGLHGLLGGFIGGVVIGGIFWPLRGAAAFKGAGAGFVAGRVAGGQATSEREAKLYGFGAGAVAGGLAAAGFTKLMVAGGVCVSGLVRDSACVINGFRETFRVLCTKGCLGELWSLLWAVDSSFDTLTQFLVERAGVKLDRAMTFLVLLKWYMKYTIRSRQNRPIAQLART